ncbi:MAG: PSD1 and planctomycete cytochrome C domain-containing protein [Planctomycetota bacterium]|nr:PSD1 and planctomycete cytochrome C domain-containing protein [Planctomycetota bacterium]
MKFFTRSVAFFLFSSALLPVTVSLADEDRHTVDFVRDIKPLLSANCFQCHGPDAKTREADLRLDGDRSGFADVIGNSAESTLLDRISSHDPDEVMPPPGSGKKRLSGAEVERIRQWISQGAQVSGHWSYQPIRRPELPEVVHSGWSKNAVDRFILSRLEALGLQPNARADQSTLIRRVSLDLAGLPPAVTLGDSGEPVDYDQAVERLLASPSFGERMAIEWLDLVRYADTSGIHSDNPISMSPYRDYVIDAFNASLPFDRFTREQIAGDLLPNATLEQRVASAYNRLNMMTTEGGAQDKEYLARYAADRVRTTSVTWLGSTLGCAECHDHKYDPFSSRDFYRFAAFFADITEKGYYPGAERSGDWGPRLEIPTATQLAEQQAAEKELVLLEKNLVSEKKKQLGKIDEWIREIRQQPAWKTFDDASFDSQSGTDLKVLEDGSLLASGKRAATDIYRLSTGVTPSQLGVIRLDVLPHDSLPQKGPGRAGNGNFVLSEIRLELKSSRGSRFAKFTRAVSTFDQTLAGEHTPYKKWHAASAIDNDRQGPKPGWAILPEVGKAQSALFVISPVIEPREDERLVIHLEQKHDNPGHVIGRFRLSHLPQATDAVLASLSMESDLKRAIDRPASQRTPAEQEKIRSAFLSENRVLAEIGKQVSAARNRLAEMRKKWVTVLTTVSRAPRQMRILPRGNWLDESGPVVTAGVPSFLPSGEANPAGRLSRLELADWLVSRQNPLTARVQVNRLWKKLFGTGLVPTGDDFGSQGTVPSHPELLDYLALDLMESGWDLKYLVRLLTQSATYQQSSVSSDRLDELDPRNRWLARQNRFRVEAEIVRDQALATSGLLVQEVGGPSARPYQPSGYYQHLNFPRRTYQEDRGKNQYRRGLYTHWQRLFLHPALLAFDAPSREECTAERVRSNTPQQALVLLNDPSFVEAARSFAGRIREREETFDKKFRYAFQQVLGRAPNRQELTILKLVYQKSLEEGQANREILKVGQLKQDGGPELVAWIAVARVLFNLHEFTTRY